MTEQVKGGNLLGYKKGTTQGEVKKVDINDPEISWLITDDQRVQLEEEIELQDGAGAEFDQELVSKGELHRSSLDPRLPIWSGDIPPAFPSDDNITASENI